MRIMCKRLLALLAGGMLVAVIAPLPAPGQAVEKANAKALPPGRTRSKISEEDFKTLIRLELEAGARTDARKAPTAEALNGPPLSEREKLLQVMSRLSYGPRPGEVDRILKEGTWKDWATKQLDPKAVDDTAHQQDIEKRYRWIKMPLSEIRKNYPIARNSEQNAQLRKELPESVVYRALNSNRQFNEVICDFWRNHFCINQPATGAPWRSWTAVRYEEDVIRRHALGKFKDMLFASATHPAMLEFLDNYISRANAWNENYARELMELHTLGADRHYNEYDVLELSKVLTGWTYNRDLEFSFNQAWHQPGSKTVLRTQIPQGYQGGEQALYMLAMHKGTADYIAEKLCRYLVNDNPPKELVKKVSRTFQRTKGDLPKVYAEIIFSDEFLERGNYRSKFKTPLEFTVSTLRATGSKLHDGGQVLAILDRMGEPIYDCVDPTGYYDVAESWMDSGVLTSRWDFCWKLVRGSIDGVEVPSTLLNKYNDLKTPEEKWKAMVDDIIAADIGERTRKILRDASETGDTQRMMSIVLGSPDFQQQ
jgi:uncharacterized protein (DUF1800 family)